MQHQRRIFRGRGGPTDRRLPKHNAARRRQTHRDGGDNHRTADLSAERSDQQVCPSENDGNDLEKNIDLSRESIPSDSSCVGQDVQNDKRNEDSTNTGTPLDSDFHTEMEHLAARIRNNKTSLRTSKISQWKLDTYKSNVLFAVRNCAKEFGSILRRYRCTTEYQDTNDRNDNKHEQLDTCRITGLDLFELVQSAMQCGPLTGAKPGYFARCGCETAQLALDFLQDILPDPNNCQFFWTAKQIRAIEKWKVNASKAARQNKGPSKSVAIKVESAENRSEKRRLSKAL